MSAEWEGYLRVGDVWKSADKEGLEILEMMMVRGYGGDTKMGIDRQEKMMKQR